MYLSLRWYFYTIFYTGTISTIPHVGFWYHSRRSSLSTMAYTVLRSVAIKNTTSTIVADRNRDCDMEYRKKESVGSQQFSTDRKIPNFCEEYIVLQIGVYIATRIAVAVLIPRKNCNRISTDLEVLWLRSPGNVATRLRG